MFLLCLQNLPSGLTKLNFVWNNTILRQCGYRGKARPALLADALSNLKGECATQACGKTLKQVKALRR